MHTGLTTAVYPSQRRPFGAYNSPATIRVHPAHGERPCLDSEQQASAAILTQEGHHAYGGHHDSEDDEDDESCAQSMSTSLYLEPPVSVSPAAMFLSAFTSPKPAEPLPDAEGDVVSGYTLGRIVGYGAFSTIREAFSASGDLAAVKIIRHSDHSKQGNRELARKRVRREAEVWSTFSHENILPLFSSAHTAYADYFFTLFCPVGSLYDLLKREGCPALPQDDAGMMFRQVVRGLRYLHEVACFVHRDIKLENVLVDESGVCRIGDFGMTRKIGEPDEDEEESAAQPASHGAPIQRAVSLAVPSTAKRTARSSLQAQIARHRNSTSSVHTPAPCGKFQPGSLPYAAPELLLPNAGSLLPHPRQDIWALGVLLYALLTGRLPFTDSFEPRLQMKILNGSYEVPPDVGRGAERVLQGCLERSEQARWTIAMVDEVAWGIGWGTEGDDVTPAESDEEFVHHPSQSRSRSRCAEDTIPEDPEWTQEEPRSRASIEAASRRSSSRMQRSQSRAPVPVASRSSSVHPLLNRSASRHSHSRAPSPSLCALNATVSPSSTRSPSSARSPSTHRSSQLFDTSMLSPPVSLERGRRRQKASTSVSTSSRSPSPTTPIDTVYLRAEQSRGRRRPAHLVRVLDELDETEDAFERQVRVRPASPHSKTSWSASTAGELGRGDHGSALDDREYEDDDVEKSPASAALHRVALSDRMRGYPTSILTMMPPPKERRARSRSGVRL